MSEQGKNDHKYLEKDPTRPDRAADPQHEGRREERERLEESVTPPGKPKGRTPPQ